MIPRLKCIFYHPFFSFFFLYRKKGGCLTRVFLLSLFISSSPSLLLSVGHWVIRFYIFAKDVGLYLTYPSEVFFLLFWFRFFAEGTGMSLSSRIDFGLFSFIYFIEKTDFMVRICLESFQDSLELHISQMLLSYILYTSSEVAGLSDPPLKSLGP